MFNSKFNAVKTVLTEAGISCEQSELLVNMVLECVDFSEDDVAADAFDTLASLDWVHESPELAPAMNALFSENGLLARAVAALAAAL